MIFVRWCNVDKTKWKYGTLYNTTGFVCFTGSLCSKMKSNTVSLNTNTYTNGLYQLQQQIITMAMTQSFYQSKLKLNFGSTHLPTTQRIKWWIQHLILIRLVHLHECTFMLCMVITIWLNRIILLFASVLCMYMYIG